MPRCCCSTAPDGTSPPAGIAVPANVGRPTSAGQRRPANVSLIVLPPPHSPILNPVERIWPYPRGRFLSLRLSLRLSADLDAIIDGCCDAWNRLAAEPGRIASRTDCPFLRSVRIS